MNTHQNHSESLLLVRFKVAESSGLDFDKWKQKAVDLIKTFKGFVAISFLKQVGDYGFVHVMIRFDCEEHIKEWLHSDTRKEIFNGSESSWLTERQEVIHDETIFWYRIFEGTKKWKQWAVTFIAVYPLTLVIPWLVSGMAGIIPLYFFAGIISAVMISGFMIFLVMPFIHNLFKNWLHE